MKNILVHTDFSGHSNHLIDEALKLFDGASLGRFLIVNSYMVPSAGVKDVIALNDQMKAQNRSLLEKERLRLRERFPHHPFHIDTATHIGSMGTVLTHLLQSEKFDLVMMAHGSHVPEPLLAVLRQSRTPILMIAS